MRITLVQPEKLPNDHALLAPKKTGGNFGLYLAQNDLLMLLVCSVRIRTRSDVRPGPRRANPLTIFTLNTSCSRWNNSSSRIYLSSNAITHLQSCFCSLPALTPQLLN